MTQMLGKQEARAVCGGKRDARAEKWNESGSTKRRRQRVSGCVHGMGVRLLIAAVTR
ncbi:hypothetical protein [Burkholderia sp. BCC1972]|uniref:hypothetical protein n=1 Tax=Burkholderia sp. BCC1972 TaxID=2817438 RepID=UPI002ABD8790|nr:hypothetical protein [Burkholderia sp. BCC1972]